MGKGNPGEEKQLDINKEKRIVEHQEINIHDNATAVINQVPVNAVNPAVPAQENVAVKKTVVFGPLQQDHYSDLKELSKKLSDTGVHVNSYNDFYAARSQTIAQSTGLVTRFAEKDKQKKILATQNQVIRNVIGKNRELIDKVEVFATSFNQLFEKLKGEDYLPQREKDARLIRFTLPFADELRQVDREFSGLQGFTGNISLNIARFYHNFGTVKARADKAAQNEFIEEYETEEEIAKSESLKKAKLEAAKFLKREEPEKVKKNEIPLTALQRKDLLKVEQWLVTHAHDNGADFEKLVDNLLGKTERERFFVYYLIVNKKEETGDVADCISVQNARISVSDFDKAMSSRFKIFRTKAGAYRWEKIEKAIQTGLGLSLPLSMASSIHINHENGYVDTKEAKDQRAVERDAQRAEIRQRNNLGPNATNEELDVFEHSVVLEDAGRELLERGTALLELLKDNSQAENTDHQKIVKKEMDRFQESLDRYSKANNDFKTSVVSKLMSGQGFLFGTLGGLGTLGTGIASADTITKVTKGIEDAGADLAKIREAFGPLTEASKFNTAAAMSGLSLISGLSGFISALGMTINTVVNFRKDRKIEVLENLVTATQAFAASGKSITTGISTANLLHLSKGIDIGINSAKLGAASSALGYAKAGLDVAVCGVKTVTAVKRGRNISSAVKKLNEQSSKKGEKFDLKTDMSEEAKLLRLSNNIKKKKATEAIVAGVSALFSIAAITPIGLLAGLVVTASGILVSTTVGIGLGMKFGEGAIKEKAINDIFDPKQIFTEEELRSMKPHEVTKRIRQYSTEAAASMGMSRERLFTAILTQHAENVHRKLFYDDDGKFIGNLPANQRTEDQKIYYEIAKSFGCSVSFGSTIGKCRPTEATLLKKMKKM